MLPSLTPAVTRALDAARRYASTPEQEVLPTHLLHALLEEEDGAAVNLAVQTGLDLALYLARRPTPAASAPHLPLSRTTETALFLASELVGEWSGEGDVSSEAVLLALL